MSVKGSFINDATLLKLSATLFNVPQVLTYWNQMNNMERIELSCPETIHKSRNNAAKVGWLAAVALLGLMLWLGAAASVSAQSIAPTSPCPVTQNFDVVPPGWVKDTGTPDCSTLATHGGASPAFAWVLGSVPATPGGHDTFVTIGAAATIGGAAPGFVEGLSTTITGLQSGGQYNINIYFNGNYTNVNAGENNYSRSCPGRIAIDGVSTDYPVASGNTWTQRSYPFTATGTSAVLAIQTLPVSGGCQSNIYVGTDAVVPVVVDADLQMTKTVSPTGAVASGSVLTYTLVARNNGPSATANVLLRDTPSAGLNGTTPSPTATCSASGGASCPGATVPVSSLTGGGVTLPNLPVGGQVAVTMQCTVTATGR